MSARLPVGLVGFNVGGNPPLGLACLKAYAESLPELQSDVDIRLYDYSLWCAPEAVIADLQAAPPAVLGLNAMHGSLAKALKVASYTKALAPATLVVLGGIEATPIAEQVLARCAAVDLIVYGEGEETFADILRLRLGQGLLDRVAGTVVRREGKVVRNPPRPPIDLSLVPSPYLSGVLDPDQYDAVHLETYRGCVYRCEFCYEGRGFAQPRCFDLEQVLAEIGFILDRGCPTVKFYDTTFNQFRQRTLTILDFIAAKNARGHLFGAEVRMELFDRELAEACSRARCLDIETGLQSLQSATLASLQRKTAHTLFEHNLRQALQTGLNVFVHIMGGLPGDRLEDTLRAYDYVLGLGAEPCLFHTRILPGTALYERACREGFVFDREPPYDVVQHPTFSVADYRRYNHFGLARLALAPVQPLLSRLAAAGAPPASALIEAFGRELAGQPDWERLVGRYRWWEDAADPTFLLQVQSLRARLEDRLRHFVALASDSLTPQLGRVALAWCDYLLLVDRIKRCPAPDARSVPLWPGARLRTAAGVAILSSAVDLRPLISDRAADWRRIEPAAQLLLVVRTPRGTVTKAVNAAMARLVAVFAQPISLWDAIAAYGGAPLSELEPQLVTALATIVSDLYKEGVLRMENEPAQLAGSERLVLRTLGPTDLEAVLGIYRENSRFFQTLFGIDEPPIEHILSDMEDGPPGYAAHKHFLGIGLRESGELIGVADFVVDYPVAGKGCLGLLLLAERHQSAGLGTEAVALVEDWAHAAHGVHEVALGVELVNERARRFWRKCGYAPTGELFEAVALGRSHQAEWLVKHLK